jgi:Xaa-Pro aminopeptidase
VIEKKLKAIRTLMKDLSLDAYILFHDDEFHNEYLPPHNERLAFLTGFTGSSGYCVITHDHAALFVPGLYTLQVRMETPHDLFTYHDFKKDGLSHWLIKHCPKNHVIGFDSQTVNHFTAHNLIKKLTENDLSVEIIQGIPLIDKLWDNHNRPSPSCKEIVLYDETLAGLTVKQKQNTIIQSLKQDNVDATVINELDAIAWFLNIRGNDVPYNPLVLSYLVIKTDGTVHFFVDLNKISPSVQEHLDTYNISVHPIKDFHDNLATLKSQIVLLNTMAMPVAVSSLLKNHGATVQHGQNPCTLPKAIKTESEQNSTRQAHVVDGVALTRFLHWLDTVAQHGTVTELDAVSRLESFRQENTDYKGPSFDTIAGAGANGAIIHYRVNNKTNTKLGKNTLFLCDSGGQYTGGTTDVTRTVAIGTPSDEMIKNFTLVLKGHIAVALQVMEQGTTGDTVDIIARKALKDHGLNYNHGTGHGVGIQLCVHEGPAGISPHSTIPLQSGMLLSNEPGYYKEDEYGIRIENLALILQDDNGNMVFETITLAPIDKTLIDFSLLNNEEKSWLDSYHQHVFKTIAPHLDPDQKIWLKQKTAPHSPK